jgi:predicted AAA+ superfamily ATPase
MNNMTIFKRKIEEQIVEYIGTNKVLLIFGPRQAGKTTLAKKLLQKNSDSASYFNCEEMSVRKHFRVGEPDKLKEFIGEHKLVVFDEAQTIENIGAILKVFVDKYSDVQIIATGSSSFDLANKINEPLTGRAISFTLLPLSIGEICSMNTVTESDLHTLMRFGSYPEVVSAKTDEQKATALRNITTSYLYKDIFTFEKIKSPLHFEQLLRLLAHQVGSMVSFNELSQNLAVSRQTIEKYIRLLEQAYVIKRVHAFAKNKRNEIKRAFKVYFIDSGVRNALIDDFDSVQSHHDVGHLFEQFCFTELLKDTNMEIIGPRIQFWRTHKGHEIDFIIEKGKVIKAIECKWSNNKEPSFNIFSKAYPDASVSVMNRETILKYKNNI